MLLILTGLSAGALHGFQDDHGSGYIEQVAEKPSKAFISWGFDGGLGMVSGVVIPLDPFRHVYQGIASISSLARQTLKFWWDGSQRSEWSIWNNRSGLRVPKSTAGHKSFDNRVVFGVGLFHGMAGTGHLLGVLPSLLLSQVSAAVYLGMYFISAIGAMMGFGRRCPKSFRCGFPSNVDATDCNRFYRCRIVLDFVQTA